MQTDDPRVFLLLFLVVSGWGLWVWDRFRAHVALEISSNPAKNDCYSSIAQKYERIVSATVDGISLIDRNYVYQIVNQTYLDYNQKRYDEIVGHTVSELLGHDTFVNVVKPYLDQCLNGQTVQYESWFNYVTLGRQFVSVTYSPYRELDGTITGVVVSTRNLTDLKRAEEQLQQADFKYQTLVEQIPGVVYTSPISATSEFAYISPQIQDLLNIPSDQWCPGFFNSWTDYVHPDDRERVMHAIQYTLATQEPFTAEYRMLTQDGNVIWVRDQASLVYATDQQTLLLQGVALNITDRKAAETRLKASLAEKEVLLKEIHHRVKNNLQIIDGLLQMQARRASAPLIRRALQDSQNRIASIALVHEKLYCSSNLANIDFTHYIPDLVFHLFETYKIGSNQIHLSIQVDPITLDIETAITCGLILNEIVSNALKYAFPNQRTGEIQIRFYPCDHRMLVLSIQDNGIGLPATVDIDHTQTLGMALIRGLTEQLEGSLDIDRQHGTRFTITFPQPEAK